MNIENRIRKIEKALTACGEDPCYVDIWSLPKEQWAELAEWVLGNTDKRPDFWPSEERAAELKQRGFTIVLTRDELRKVIERTNKLEQERKKVGTGICYGD